jgi:hypothetical protein
MSHSTRPEPEHEKKSIPFGDTDGRPAERPSTEKPEPVEEPAPQPSPPSVPEGEDEETS